MTMFALSNQPLAPLWFVAPLTMFTLAIVTIHLVGLARTAMPASRRRIRSANSALMLIMLPLALYALAIVPPSDGHAFVIAWMILGALLVVVLSLAWLDVANNLRLGRTERIRVARDIAAAVRTARALSGQPPVVDNQHPANDAHRAS